MWFIYCIVTVISFWFICFLLATSNITVAIAIPMGKNIEAFIFGLEENVDGESLVILRDLDLFSHSLRK